MGIKEEIKQDKFKSNKEMALVNILYTHNWVRDEQQDTLKKHNILSQHYNILRIVKGKHPKVVFPGEIKEVMLDKGRDLTRLIDKLVTLGYLNRNICEANRRMVEISITQKGIDIVEVVGAEMSKGMEKFISINEEEALQLSNLLDKLRG